MSISWDYPEGDPGHQFNVIPDRLPLSELQVGDVLRINYSIETAEYHQIQITVPDWDPRLASIDVTETGTYEFTITQEFYDTIQSEGGLIIVGHGYYLDMVSVE